MKKILIACMALFAGQAFAAWNTISYNSNDVAITGANFTPPTGGFSITWTGYIQNNRSTSSYIVKVWDYTAGALAPVVNTSFQAYATSTNYTYNWNLFPGHYHNCTLYARTNQATGTVNPATHVTTYCWISAW